MKAADKQEQEAIEYFKKHIKYFEEQIKFIEATDCDYYDEELELYRNRVKQFNTVLSILKEKDKKIDKLKKHNNELLRKLRNRVKGEQIKMSADEMFKKLGYKKQYENENIYYYIDVNIKDDFIVFETGDKSFAKKNCYNDAGYISMEELQAINKKCEELGWK